MTTDRILKAKRENTHPSPEKVERPQEQPPSGGFFYGQKVCEAAIPAQGLASLHCLAAVN